MRKVFNLLSLSIIFFVTLYVYQNVYNDNNVLNNSINSTQKVNIVNNENNNSYNCKVNKIVDGDTFYSSCDKTRVRVAGIDTPEKFYRDTPECFALEASLKAQELILNKNVSFDNLGIDTTKTRDVVKVYVEDGLLFNIEMVKQGYAFAWTNFDNIDSQFKKQLDEAQQYAKENKLGLWKKCHPKYDYKKKKWISEY